jgi:hypothetical protein
MVYQQQKSHILLYSILCRMKKFLEKCCSFFFTLLHDYNPFSKKHFTSVNNLLSHNLPGHTKMDYSGRYLKFLGMF